MLDQVNKLKGSAVSAAAICKGQTQSTLDLIIDGEISLVNASQEQMLNTDSQVATGKKRVHTCKICGQCNFCIQTSFRP